MLGPLLFLIFINDIVYCSLDAKFALFADDTCVFINHHDLNLLVYRANEVLKNVQAWLSCNRLTLDRDKTQYVNFHRKQRGLPSSTKEIVLYNEIVSLVTNVNFLGLIINENLTWVPQINNVVKVSSKFVFFLYKVKSCLNTNSPDLIYSSLRNPNIKYCASVWGFSHRTQLNKTMVTQKNIRLTNYLTCVGFI